MSKIQPYNMPELEDVIDKLKHREVWGNSRPELINRLNSDGNQSSSLSLHWLCAAQGDIWLRKLSSENEKEILKYLIDLGMAVPTFIETHYGLGDMQHYQHFDDVNWGLDGKNVIMYRLSQNPHYPEAPDEIIPTDEKHEKAIGHLRHLLTMGSAILDPETIRLKTGEVISPFITGREQVALRQRQMGIQPNQLKAGLRTPEI